MMRMLPMKISTVIIATCTALLAGCQAVPATPVAIVSRVDLSRFMGDWYVIASIPTFIETTAFNAVESYGLDADGSIATTFTFLDNGFDGRQKRYHPRGFVVDRQSNAVWDMQFIWPIKADYRIAWLAEDYSLVVIAREKRDYAWIMARTPVISEQQYQERVTFLAAQGYDITRIRKVPQRWN